MDLYCVIWKSIHPPHPHPDNINSDITWARMAAVSHLSRSWCRPLRVFFACNSRFCRPALFYLVYVIQGAGIAFQENIFHGYFFYLLKTSFDGVLSVWANFTGFSNLTHAMSFIENQFQSRRKKIKFKILLEIFLLIDCGESSKNPGSWFATVSEFYDHSADGEFDLQFNAFLLLHWTPDVSVL